MGRLKLNQEMLGLAVVLEKITKVGVKDCFQDEQTIYVIVAPGDLGKVIGRGGVNIRQVQEELGKKIKVIEFRDKVAEFVRNVIYPLKVEEVLEEDTMVVIKDPSYTTRSLVVGRDGKNLKLINRAVQRFFNKEVKVV